MEFGGCLLPLSFAIVSKLSFCLCVGDDDNLSAAALLLSLLLNHHCCCYALYPMELLPAMATADGGIYFWWMKTKIFPRKFSSTLFWWGNFAGDFPPYLS
jgi:hypothetical protein